MGDAIDSMFAMQSANTHLIEALAMALDQAKVLPLKDSIPMMELMWLNTRLKGETDTAKCMSFAIARLKSFSDSGLPPIESLSLETALYEQTEPVLRPALEDWLATATPDEISDDILECLRKFQQKRERGNGSGGG